ncbi:hypothetical protein FA224_21540 [Pseudomonas aeruginosa]|nr:hypothetical protein [Pseudomonas aeruginosa]MCO3179482.1 hypothetical protein [Pseudomonas aeruginosa]TFW19852.1 hypothetical protein E4L40_22760 [Pseudomonas putida]TFW33962.1 hypothetical protein E4195_24700 [Pseudomonas putida]
MFPCQVLQRQLAAFPAQPAGPGLFFRDAALLAARLAHQTSRLVPSLAKKQAPARPRMKRQQILAFDADFLQPIGQCRSA